MTVPAHPATIGRFRIIGLASQGGMGAVYRAEDPDDGSPVAVKYLPEAFGRRPEFVERFKREARIYASLSHPAIPKFRDFGTDHGRYYLAMEWVAGITLQTWIVKQERLPDDRTWRQLFTAIAQAVAYAHSRGVLHRDLSTRNVMVMPDGRIQIMDFGLSKTVSEAHFTQTGDLLGTPEYTAPEQLTAAGKVTAAADLWSVGVLGYELAARVSPFAAANNPAVIRRILDDRFVPPPAGTLNPGLSVRSASVIDRCLERDLDRRYATAAELLADLAGDPAQPVVIRPRRRSRQRWRIGLAVAGVVLLAVAGFAAYRYRPAGQLAGPTALATLPPSTPLATLPFEQLIGSDDTDASWYFYVLRDVEYPNQPRDDFMASIQVPTSRLSTGSFRLKDEAGNFAGIVTVDQRNLIDNKLRAGMPVGLTRRRFNKLEVGMPVYIVESKDNDYCPTEPAGPQRISDPKLRFRGRLVRVVQLEFGQFELAFPDRVPGRPSRVITTLAEMMQ